MTSGVCNLCLISEVVGTFSQRMIAHEESQLKNSSVDILSVTK